MTIDFAVAADIPEVAALWCDAFPGKRTVAERARMLETGGRYGGLETVLVARESAGGDARDPAGPAPLLAACKLYRMTQYIAGVAMPMMGLAAVAVTPAARRQGIGAALCARAIDAARDRGDVVSTLYPFRARYYERLGWGLVGELREHRFRTAALPLYDEAHSVRPARHPADADAIAACYARVAARSNGPIERDARLWAWRLADEDLGVRAGEEGAGASAVADAGAAAGAGNRRRGAVVYEEEEDGVTGYALLRRRACGRAEDATIHVRELVAETEAAYRGLLGHLARQAVRWPRIRHAARAGEAFPDRLADAALAGSGRARSLYFPTARVLRGPMLRILDLPRALMLRRYFDTTHGALLDATIEVAVDDAQVPSNRGPWTVRIQGDSAAHVDGPAQARIDTEAATFARIFAGDLAPGEAVRIGRATAGGDVRLMDAAFATRERFWLLDEF